MSIYTYASLLHSVARLLADIFSPYLHSRNCIQISQCRTHRYDKLHVTYVADPHTHTAEPRAWILEGSPVFASGTESPPAMDMVENTHETMATPFSSFSVGFCINEEKVICYQLELGK